jgi:MoaA/NifB/PqqE/SkfB family radical SAM enzyme
LRAAGLSVRLVYVATSRNPREGLRVKALAEELGASFAVIPTIGPRMDGDPDPVSLNVPQQDLAYLCLDPEPPAASPDAIPCTAGHTSCYISPSGAVFPCVKFPLDCGNVRGLGFSAIWTGSPELRQPSAHAT